MRLIWSLLAVSAILGAAAASAAQPAARPRKSPKVIVEEFWKMDTEGGRLTEAGWRAADRFFVRPIAPPLERTICVFDYDFAVRNPKIQDNKAQVIVGTAGTVWKIDSHMRLGICSDQGKDFWVHKLVLSAKHWEFTSDGRSLKEVDGEPEWRFEKEGNHVYVTVETAIRYLSQVRDSSTDPVIKKNADRALEVLGRQRH